MTPYQTRTVDDLRADLKRRYNAPDWPHVRLRIFKRDGFRCRECGGKQNLRCHHLTYKNLWRERDEDLVTLCNNCHPKGRYSLFAINQNRRNRFWILVVTWLAWKLPIKVIILLFRFARWLMP